MTYLLLVASVLVWGYVIHMIISGLGGESEVGYVPSSPKSVNFIQEDTVKVNLRGAYRDPFLGEAYLEKKVSKVTNNKQVRKAEKVSEVAKDWSFIQYFGEFENRQSKNITALTSVYGSDRMMHVGEVVDAVKCLKIMKDSILVQHEGYKKYILRGN